MGRENHWKRKTAQKEKYDYIEKTSSEYKGGRN